jgi:hypothetical protein
VPPFNVQRGARRSFVSRSEIRLRRPLGPDGAAVDAAFVIAGLATVFMQRVLCKRDALLQQLGMRADVRYPARVHLHDEVCLWEVLQLVCDEDARLAAQQAQHAARHEVEADVRVDGG